MDATAWITQVLGHEWNVPPLDSDNTDRRLRLQEFLIQLVERIWYARAWPWRRTIATVNVTSGLNYANLPANFQAIGDRRYGGVWLTSTGEPLTHIPEWEMRDIQESLDGGATDHPEVYSLYDQETGSPFQYRIQLPKASANYSVRVGYEMVPPTIDDSANTANLAKIPVQYHQSCLIPAGRAFARRAFGAQDVDVDAEIESAIKRMARAERPGADGLTQMPAFDGGWS